MLKDVKRQGVSILSSLVPALLLCMKNFCKQAPSLYQTTQKSLQVNRIKHVSTYGPAYASFILYYYLLLAKLTISTSVLKA